MTKDKETEKELLKSPGITLFKECIAAFLGVSIIVYTFILLWPALSASPIDTTSAQGVFSILGGWGGVVLGYYFGRIPAEKAASQAEKTAIIAEKAKETAEDESYLVLNSSGEKFRNYRKRIEKLEELINRL